MLDNLFCFPSYGEGEIKSVEVLPPVSGNLMQSTFKVSSFKEN